MSKKIYRIVREVTTAQCFYVLADNQEQADQIAENAPYGMYGKDEVIESSDAADEVTAEQVQYESLYEATPEGTFNYLGLGKDYLQTVKQDT